MNFKASWEWKHDFIPHIYLSVLIQIQRHKHCTLEMVSGINNTHNISRMTGEASNVVKCPCRPSTIANILLGCIGNNSLSLP